MNVFSKKDHSGSDIFDQFYEPSVMYVSARFTNWRTFYRMGFSMHKSDEASCLKKNPYLACSTQHVSSQCVGSRHLGHHPPGCTSTKKYRKVQNRRDNSNARTVLVSGLKRSFIYIFFVIIERKYCGENIFFSQIFVFLSTIWRIFFAKFYFFYSP